VVGSEVAMSKYRCFGGAVGCGDSCLRLWRRSLSGTSNDKAKSRSFDYGVHDEAVNTFAQDDTFISMVQEDPSFPTVKKTLLPRSRRQKTGF